MKKLLELEDKADKKGPDKSKPAVEGVVRRLGAIGIDKWNPTSKAGQSTIASFVRA
jgi:hypothetical protein